MEKENLSNTSANVAIHKPSIHSKKLIKNSIKI